MRRCSTSTRLATPATSPASSGCCSFPLSRQGNPARTETRAAVASGLWRHWCPHALQPGFRFHHISTDEVFGHCVLESPATSWSKTSPRCGARPWTTPKSRRVYRSHPDAHARHFVSSAAELSRRWEATGFTSGVGVEDNDAERKPV